MDVSYPYASLAPIACVAFSPDGTQVLTGHLDTTARLLNGRTGSLLRIFHGHTNRVRSVAFSRDGRQVLTGSWDGTTGVWEAASGKEIARLISCSDGEDWLVVTPDGYFDGCPGGIKLLTLLRPGSNQMLSAAEKAKYHRLDLVERALQGQ